MPRYTKVGLYPFTSDGTNVTLASGQLRLPDGTAGAPSVAFQTKAGMYYGGVDTLSFSTNSTFKMAITGSHVVIRTDAGLTWLPGIDPTAAPDVILVRDAANTLAQRNGTVAQTSNVYNTFTDPLNYERFGIQWAANKATIGVFAAGTGVERVLALRSSDGLEFQISGPNTVFTLARDSGADPVSAKALFNLQTTGAQWGVAFAGQSQTFTTSAGGVVHVTGSFTPGSGSGSWAGLSGVFTFNGASTGEADAIRFATKTNVLTGGTIKLLSLGTTTQDAFTGYSELFSVSNIGAVTAGNSITVTSGHVYIPTGSFYLWSNSSNMSAPVNGVIRMANDAQTDFNRLILGTNDANGAAIVKDGAYLQLRLGHGSAVTGAVTASLPVAAAARDGIIAFDTTLNALVYYVGGNRYKLVGTAF